MKKLQDWLRTWTVPQAIVGSVALVCCTVLATVVTVQDDWGKLFRWLSDPATSGLLIAVATLFGTLYHRALSLPPIVVLALLGASTLTGCGAGALVAQGRAATIASVAIGSVGQELHDARTEQLDACTDTGCADAGERLWAPAVAAYESVRAALDTWIGALEVAQQAGAQDGDVLGALFVALTRLAREWNQLAAAIRSLGIPELQPPDMPPIVTALLGTGAAT